MKRMSGQHAEECPASVTLNAMGGRWKVYIVYYLLSGVKRYSELQRLIRNATPKMLTQQLRELEDDGLVQRKVYAQVPPKVEYALTASGESLKPVVDAMIVWGEKQLSDAKAIVHPLHLTAATINHPNSVA